MVKMNLQAQSIVSRVKKVPLIITRVKIFGIELSPWLSLLALAYLIHLNIQVIKMVQNDLHKRKGTQPQTQDRHDTVKVNNEDI